MKKFLPLLLILISSIFIFSCKDDDDDYVDVNVDYPTVYDVKTNLVQNATNDFGYFDQFNGTLLDQDIVLMYRKNNPTESSPIWEPLPKSYFFGSNSMDYTFNFSKTDFEIRLNSDFDLTVQNNDFKTTYLNGQTFRIVLVPAVFGKNAVDPRTLSYEEVIAKYNIDDSKVDKL